jgi:hypothetical protein
MPIAANGPVFCALADAPSAQHAIRASVAMSRRRLVDVGNSISGGRTYAPSESGQCHERGEIG